MELDPWFSENLVCPRDQQKLRREFESLSCPHGHQYPIAYGVPVMLLREVKQTHPAATSSLQQADTKLDARVGQRPPTNSESVDSFVQREIAATNGMMYKPVIGKLREYPLPTLRERKSAGDYFLDIGCNWGRWCIAASRAGYNSVGIDPSLDAILAARRIASQLGVRARYVVADARYLPFPDMMFDLAFSYSVLQHFDKEEARRTLHEMKRVLKIGGHSTVQMPNVFGLRCLYHQMRRCFREAKDFEVRYWTPSELKSAFDSLIGPSTLSVDGYFSLNPQISEAHLLPWRYRLIIASSDALRKISLKAGFMASLADSLYVTAHRLN